MRIALYNAVREAVVLQRGLSEQESINARKEIEDRGGEIVDLNEEERDAFFEAVAPLYNETRAILGDEPVNLGTPAGQS